MAMRMRLAELEAKDQVVVPSDSVGDVLVRFERPPPPAGADSQISAAFAGAEAERARPLISDTSLIVLLVLIAVAAVVLLGSVARYWRADGDALKALGSQAIVIPQLLVEGLVLSLAIIAIVILGASAKLTSEGLISVLAGIVGYAAGSRAAASSRRT
jgi:membrane-associated HD superfamily phosphohydrolase